MAATGAKPIPQGLAASVVALSNVLAGKGHGVLRGTAESVLFEVQGGGIVDSKGNVPEHLGSLLDASAGITNQSEAMAEALRIVARTDHQAAGELSRAFRPLRELGRRINEILIKVLRLREDLQEAARHDPTIAKRFENVYFPSGERSRSGSLVSARLMNRSPSGLPLVPPALADHPRVQALLGEIHQLPDPAGARCDTRDCLMEAHVYLTEKALRPEHPLARYDLRRLLERVGELIARPEQLSDSAE